MSAAASTLAARYRRFALRRLWLLAALTAVIAPEILMAHGALISTWQDARWPATLCATAYYFWRRDILGTIAVGMAVYLPLHIALGW